MFKCGQNSFSLRNKPSRTSRMKSGRTVASRFFKPSTFRTSPITRTKGRPLSRTLNVLNFASNFSNYLIFNSNRFSFPLQESKIGIPLHVPTTNSSRNIFKRGIGLIDPSLYAWMSLSSPGCFRSGLLEVIRKLLQILKNRYPKGTCVGYLICINGHEPTTIAWDTRGIPQKNDWKW